MVQLDSLDRGRAGHGEDDEPLVGDEERRAERRTPVRAAVGRSLLWNLLSCLAMVGCEEDMTCTDLYPCTRTFFGSSPCLYRSL